MHYTSTPSSDVTFNWDCLNQLQFSSTVQPPCLSVSGERFWREVAVSFLRCSPLLCHYIPMSLSHIKWVSGRVHIWLQAASWGLMLKEVVLQGLAPPLRQTDIWPATCQGRKGHPGVSLQLSVVRHPRPSTLVTFTCLTAYHVRCTYR